MNLSKNGRLVFWLIVCFSCAFILVYFLIVNIGLHTRSNKKTNLILPKREDWFEFGKIKTEIDKLKRDWDNKLKTPPKYRDDLELQQFINEEFGRQIEEIKRISAVEAQLKRAELDQAFQEYSNLHLKEVEQEYQQKFNTLNELVNRSIQQKSAEFSQQYKNYQQDLEKTYQLELVNLQLKLSVLELNPNKTGNAEAKETIKFKIDQIRQDILQKRQTQKQHFEAIFQEYEKQRRSGMDSELQSLKTELRNRFENDVKNYHAKLDLEFNEWCHKQNIQFEKAIQVRQGQKKKTN